MNPPDADLPDKVREFFQEDQPWGTDRNFNKFTSKTFNAFLILKLIIAVPVFFLDIYTTIVHLS